MKTGSSVIVDRTALRQAYTPAIMSPPGAAALKEARLLARMRTLYFQLDDTRCTTRAYARVSAEIRELALAFDTLVEARLGITPPHKK